MSSERFLQRVASELARNELAGSFVVCPNKRSAMFLRLYLQRRAKSTPMFMPRVITLQALIEKFSPGLEKIDRWEAIIALFDCYRRVMARRGREIEPEYFDRFVFWGEVVLSDFDEIDQSLASATQLYTNLRRHNEIRSDFLSDDQKDAVRNLWGDTSQLLNGSDEIDRFWLHTMGKDDHIPDPESTRGRFIALYEVLAELYSEFTGFLRSRRLATAGMRVRDAITNLEKTPLNDIRETYPKFHFVGLSSITSAQMKLLDRLKEGGAAYFYWDTAALGDIADKEFPGVDEMDRLARRYPAPGDFTAPSPAPKRTIDIIGVPSAVAQAKQAAEVVTRLFKSGSLNADGGLSTAIILPAPELLTPLLLALPPDIPAVNVSMQLPWTGTSFATLLRSVIAMQSHARRRKGRLMFFYADIIDVLSHPHIRLISAESSDALRLRIMTQSLYNIDAAEIIETVPRLAFIFRPLAPDAGWPEVYAYLTGMLSGMREALTENISAQEAAEAIEIQNLDALSERLTDLRRLIEIYGIAPGRNTLFTFFERLLSTGTLRVEGTPLRGVQVMGVLETRALDFDHIIYLSMNERTFPSKQNVRTMIPNALRRGYGLPPIERPQNTMAYYFYRSLCRASDVTLIYDSRGASKGAGEMSRFVTQLIYNAGELPDGTSITAQQLDLDASTPLRREITIEKTAEVLARLERFKRPGGAKISASALKKYMSCPLAFYLEYVCGYRTDDEPVNYLGPAALGDIFHHAMKHLYAPWKNKIITADVIEELLAGDAVRKAILEAYAEVKFKREDAPATEDELDAEGRLMTATLEEEVRGMLETEKLTYCRPGFEYIDGEYDVCEPWEIAPGLTINFRMQIDRIDRDPATGYYRFIDYKTGKDKRTAGEDTSILFNGEHDYQAVFQLLLYCEAYADLCQKDVVIEPKLHLLREIMSQGRINPLTFRRKTMEPFPALSEIFRPRLNELVKKIFDDTTPFSQAEKNDSCRYCTFANMCGRKLPKEHVNQ